MKVGNSRAQDMTGIVECEFDIRCNICYAAIVKGDGMSDIGLDLIGGVGDLPVFLVDDVKVIELEHGREVAGWRC